MKPITLSARNPDVDLTAGQQIPADCYLQDGKRLMITARSAGIPFGICRSRVYVPGTSNSRLETIGLVIKLTDQKRFKQALIEKQENAKRKGEA